MVQKNNSKIKILLSEGSSTNVREMITALGPLGYTIDVCDPNPLCMGRFSRYIRRYYRCPMSGTDPVGYIKFIIQRLNEERYDVLFPANEQAFLFAWAKNFLTPLTGLAVSDFSAFNRLQSKAAFMTLLDELDMPHPATRSAHTWAEIEQNAAFFKAPFYIKTSFGTASTGVWRIDQGTGMEGLRRRLDEAGSLDGQTEFLIQAGASGDFEQSHAIFNQGELLALHCTRRILEGAQGGAAVKMGVNRPIVRRHFETIGKHLHWHGSLSIDYFWDESSRQPSYIDANPRITEPMNALINGINLADMQVRLSLGEKLAPRPPVESTLKSHSALQAMLGAAARHGRRMDIIQELGLVLTHKGVYQNSREGMTPVRSDFPSVISLIVVLADLLINPGSQGNLTLKTISNYCLGSAIPKVLATNPEDVL